MPVREVEHMGDLLLQSCNKSFERALEELLQAVSDFLGEKGEDVGFVEFLKVGNKEEVVVSACEEVIFFYDTHGLLPKRVEVKKREDGYLIRLELAKAVPKNEIKAVTWHNLKVWKTPEGECIQVLFDL